MTDRYGVCQVCSRTTTSYSRAAQPLNIANSTRPMPARPLRAEPCGHDQPRPVVWTSNEAFTFPVNERP